MRLPQKEEGEVIGIVEHMLGANRVKIQSIDGKTRMGRIRGKMEKAGLVACRRRHSYGALEFSRR